MSLSLGSGKCQSKIVTLPTNMNIISSKKICAFRQAQVCPQIWSSCFLCLHGSLSRQKIGGCFFRGGSQILPSFSNNWARISDSILQWSNFIKVLIGSVQCLYHPAASGLMKSTKGFPSMEYVSLTNADLFQTRLAL